MISNKPKLIDLSSRAIFRITGSDTLRFLNGQLTQDIELATEANAVYTCITNAKGKLQGDAFIRLHKGEVLIDCPACLREDFFNRIDMYIIADDVEIEDVTGAYHFYHCLDKQPSEQTWECNRYGKTGFDFFSENKQEASSEIQVEELRIQRGIPVWGKELNSDTLPPEANLENRAISYTKGCYIGQEVISRMKSAGKVNKSLTCFTLSAEVELPYTIQLDEQTKPAGIITSQIHSGDKVIALGYIYRKFAEQKTFQCGEITVNVREI